MKAGKGFGPAVNASKSGHTTVTFRPSFARYAAILDVHAGHQCSEQEEITAISYVLLGGFASSNDNDGRRIRSLRFRKNCF